MRSLVLCLSMLATATPALAGSLGLTGTWEGSVSCRSQDANGKGGFKTDVTLLISQVGPTGPLVVNAVTGSSRAYSGSIIPSLAKPGEGAGAIIACGTSDDPTGGLFNDIETFQYKLGPGPGGTLKTSGANTTNGSEVDLCKGSFTRTSTISPKVAGCSPPI